VSGLPPEVEASLSDWLGAGWRAQPLAGDASVRAYYRITAGDARTYMLAYYPDEVRPQLKRGLSAYGALAGRAPLPPVLHASDDAVLQFDAGDRTIFEVLHRDREEGLRLYRRAAALLPSLQQTVDPGLNPPFTAEFFRTELEMTREFFVEALLGTGAADLDRMAPEICAEIASYPYVICHRDFHGQNIHVLNDDLYVIDYQDMRMGPDTYDLASLLRDRGVARIIGDTEELEFIGAFARQSGATGDVRRRYFATLLQRSLKVLGTFAKQPIVRGRMHYLEFIPAALEAIRRCLEELPEFGALRDIVPASVDLASLKERAATLHGLRGSS
jgi:aminoglycoside/choline kinase family phosphotransferase